MQEDQRFRQAELDNLALRPFAELRDLLPGGMRHQEAQAMTVDLLDASRILCKHPAIVMQEELFDAAWKAMNELDRLAAAIVAAPLDG